MSLLLYGRHRVTELFKKLLLTNIVKSLLWVLKVTEGKQQTLSLRPEVKHLLTLLFRNVQMSERHTAGAQGRATKLIYTLVRDSSNCFLSNVIICIPRQPSNQCIAKLMSRKKLLHRSSLVKVMNFGSVGACPSGSCCSIKHHTPAGFMAPSPPIWGDSLCSQ